MFYVSNVLNNSLTNKQIYIYIYSVRLTQIFKNEVQPINTNINKNKLDVCEIWHMKKVINIPSSASLCNGMVHFIAL